MRIAEVDFLDNHNIIKTLPESPNKRNEKIAQEIGWEGTG